MQFDSVSTFVLFVFIGGLHKTRKQEEYIEQISQVMCKPQCFDISVENLIFIDGISPSLNI